MSTPTVIVARSVLLREGIASLLQGTRYKVVGCAARPAELATAPRVKGQPSLAIIGIDLQNSSLEDAAASIRLLRSAIPGAKVVLVADGDKSVEQQIPVLSFDACIFSLCSRDTLIKVLELTSMDQRVFVFAKSHGRGVKTDAELIAAARLSPPAGVHEFRHCQNLSPRESQVLTSLAEGKSNKLIARVCHISEATVKVHLKAILRKTKAHNRTQAAIWAIQHGVRNCLSDAPAIERLEVSESPMLAPIEQTVATQSSPLPQARANLAPSERTVTTQSSPLPQTRAHLPPTARFSSASNASRAR